METTKEQELRPVMTALITMKDVLLDARCPVKWMDGVAQGALLLGMMLVLLSIFVETQR